MKIIGIFGIPCTGKSALMRRIKSSLSCKWEEKKYSTLVYETHPPYIILGKYSGEHFDGTDTLSMSVIKDAENFIASLTGDRIVLFEGDRLFNSRFLNFCQSVAGEDNCHFILLEVSQEVFVQRYKERANKGTAQSSSFIKSRLTKCRNIRVLHAMRFIWNNTISDQDYILEQIQPYLS
jgi:hypothetical protein